MTAKYACIQSHRTAFPIALMCRCLAVSRAGFYASQGRPVSARAQRDAQLDPRVRQLHAQSRGSYGAPRIRHALAAEGVHVGQKRIARRLRVLQLRGCHPRGWVRPTPVDPQHAGPANTLARDFTVRAPNTAWSADITYIPTHEGFLYLAVVLDVGTRRVLGWAMRPTLAEDVVLAALRAALATRTGRPALHHSDRGSQYASVAYQRLLALHGISRSLSRVGNCWDNAVTESFFATLKIEAIMARPFRTHAEARAALVTYIERWYNPLRLHSSLGYRSPDAYEQDYSQQTAA